MAQENRREPGRLRIPSSMPRISWRDLAVTVGPIVLLCLLARHDVKLEILPSPGGLDTDELVS